jgi:YD repeat-containing protein
MTLLRCKISVFTAVGVLFAGLSFAMSDRERDGLLGPVQTVSTEYGKLEEGSSEKTEKAAYDRAGNMVASEMAYTKIGHGNATVSLRTTYERDRSGAVTSSKAIAEDGALQSKTSYKYDGRGNLTERLISGEKGDLIFKELSKYDDSNRKIETSYHLPSNMPGSLQQYLYDERGNVSSTTSFKDCISGERCRRLDYRAVNTYDGKGNLIKTTLYKGDGSIEEVQTFHYTASNVLIEKDVFGSDTSLRDKQIYVYKFDEFGNWIERVTTTLTEMCRQSDTCKEKRTFTYFKNE